MDSVADAVNREPNKAGEGNGAVAFSLHIERLQRAVPDQRRQPP